MKIVFNDKFLDTRESGARVGSIYTGRRLFMIEVPGWEMRLFRRILGGHEPLDNGKKCMVVDEYYSVIVWYSPQRSKK